MLIGACCPAERLTCAWGSGLKKTALMDSILAGRVNALQQRLDEDYS